MRTMRKFICMMLTVTMIIGMATNVYATQVITFDESGKGQVTTKDPNATTTPVADPNVTATQTPVPAADPEAGKSIDSVLESIFGKTDEKTGDSTTAKKGYIALGQDLTSEQLATVLALLEIPTNEVGNYVVVYTTNAEEHAALDKYIDSSIIGRRSLSSVLVKPAEKGHGVVVTTKNINYCTTNMYRNALITAGVTDADITVVAPSSISGTAALIGALKAYESMSGKEVSKVALDTSLNELVTTGELSKTVGGDAEAEELISYIKTVVATNNLETEEEMEAAIRKGMTDLNVTLTDQEIADTVSLMMKIKAMGIDFNVLAEQADDIYAKYKDDIKAGTFDISKVDLKDAGIQKILANALSNKITEVGTAIKDFFTGLFNRKK